MNKIEELLNQISSEIKSYPLVKEFFLLKDEIESNDELKEITKSMQESQRIMCSNMDNNDLYLPAKAKYEEASNKYNNHPLIVNFEQVKEEVIELLNQIKDVLE